MNSQRDIIGVKEYEQAMRYRTIIKRVGIVFTVETAIIAGICSRESRFGLLLKPAGASGLGDGGHGHGLMQIDDRWHPDFCKGEAWKDPEENISYAVEKVLRPSLDYAKTKLGDATIADRLLVGIAGYNCGASNAVKGFKKYNDADYYTTGKDYSMDVMARADWFVKQGWVQ